MTKRTCMSETLTLSFTATQACLPCFKCSCARAGDPIDELSLLDDELLLSGLTRELADDTAHGSTKGSVAVAAALNRASSRCARRVCCTCSGIENTSRHVSCLDGLDAARGQQLHQLMTAAMARNVDMIVVLVLTPASAAEGLQRFRSNLRLMPVLGCQRLV